MTPRDLEPEEAEALDRVARAMTAHPAPDLAARVRARLEQPTARPSLRPLWAAAALTAAVVLGLRLAPDPDQAPAGGPVTTVAQSAAPGPARPQLTAGSVTAPPVRRERPARAAAPAVPAEPWPGDELQARPLRFDALVAPPLALDAIALDPLERPAPLAIETDDAAADGAARPDEKETR